MLQWACVTACEQRLVRARGRGGEHGSGLPCITLGTLVLYWPQVGSWAPQVHPYIPYIHISTIRVSRHLSQSKGLKVPRLICLPSLRQAQQQLIIPCSSPRLLEKEVTPRVDPKLPVKGNGAHGSPQGPWGRQSTAGAVISETGAT